MTSAAHPVRELLRVCKPLRDRLVEIATDSGEERIVITAQGLGRLLLIRLGIDPDAEAPGIREVIEAARREAKRDALDGVLLGLGLIEKRAGGESS